MMKVIKKLYAYFLYLMLVLSLSCLVNATSFKFIAVEGEVTCGILVNGAALCWGNNEKEVLGDGTNIPSSNTAVPVSGGYKFSTISFASDLFTAYAACGILTNGSAVCWGNNRFGQLGRGNNISSNTPVFVSGGYSFTEIYGGKKDTFCGLIINGSAVCWGGGIGGPLGDGTEKYYSDVPVFVSGNYEYSSISLNSFTSCGVLTNGSGVCWGGTAQFGGLGDGKAHHAHSPVFVFGDYNFSSIVMDDWTSCGLLVNGSAVCWGSNILGELGQGNDNKNSDSQIPVFVAGGYKFKQIVSEFGSFCGLIEDGRVACWGSNGAGQLGDGTNKSHSSSPVIVSQETNFKSITAATSSSCGLLGNGSAVCWGANYGGVLGDGTNTDSNVPVFVKGGYTFSSLSGGGYTFCGILVNGSAVCWGRNNYGQLGDGTNVDSSTPVFVVIPSSSEEPQSQIDESSNTQPTHPGTTSTSIHASRDEPPSHIDESTTNTQPARSGTTSMLDYLPYAVVFIVLVIALFSYTMMRKKR
jgi:alpha-tubulin suppressor-like RCC1 family protein